MNFRLNVGNNYNDELKGYVDVNGEKVSYAFYNGLLNLFPDIENLESHHNMVEIFPGVYAQQDRSGEPIENISIYGRTAEGKDVIFFVSDNKSVNNVFEAYPVISYYVYEKQSVTYEKIEPNSEKRQIVRHDNKIMGLLVTGREIDYFFNPATAFTQQYLFDDNRRPVEFKVTAGRSEEKDCGSFKWGDIEVKMTITSIATVSQTATPFKSKSRLKLQFSEEVTIEQIDDLLVALQGFFSYICRRENVYFDSVNTISDTGKNFGTYTYISNSENSETHKDAAKRVISFEYISDKTAKLFVPFVEEKMYLNHIPKNVAATNIYGPERIIFLFVAFERECHNLYPEETVRSEEYIDAKKILLEATEELINTNSGKKKKYLKSFKHSIEKMENSFGQRLKTAIEGTMEYLIPFLQHEYGESYADEIEEITDRMNALRNDSAHGNFITEIDPRIIKDLHTIETLLYALRLKDIGVPVTVAQNAICEIMGINMYIPMETEVDESVGELLPNETIDENNIEENSHEEKLSDRSADCKNSNDAEEQHSRTNIKHKIAKLCETFKYYIGKVFHRKK